MTFVLSGYVGVEQIGRGGIGDVYRATRSSTGAVVAIKVLRDVTDGSAAWRRARRELAALVSLAGHAHVVQVYEVLDLDGRPALVMEHVPGGSVGDLATRRGGVLSAGEVAMVGVHAARALVAAHEQAIVHRDVKPQNLLVDAYGHVKLCDFGVAALTRSAEFRDRTTALSMRYSSPEDLEDPGEGVEVGPPSDVYSLGATLLHLARGAPPALKDRLASWTPPGGGGDDALERLDRVIARCLRPVAGERPGAAELLDELERLGDHVYVPKALTTGVEPGPGTLPVDQPGSDITDVTVHREPRRPLPAAGGRGSRAVLAATGVAVVALAGLAAVVSGRRGGDHPAPAAELAAVVPAVELGAASTAVSIAVPTTASTSPSLERPDGLAPLEVVTWPLGPTGECLVQHVGAGALAPVDCSEPHDLQRFASGELDGHLAADGSFDGTVGRACEQRLRELVDPATLPDDVAIASTRPSPASWASGDRSYQCLLGVPNRRSIGDVLPADATTEERDDAGRSRP